MKQIISLLVFVFAIQAAGNTQDIPEWSLDDLKTAIKNADHPTIFNFWSTTCKPCVEEIPYFQELVKKYDSAGVKLVLVNLDMAEDYPQKIRSFASAHKLMAPIKFLNETNADLFCPAVDESWSGAIPATLLINNKTGYRKFFEDQLSRENLEKEIKAMIN